MKFFYALFVAGFALAAHVNGAVYAPDYGTDDYEAFWETDEAQYVFSGVEAYLGLQLRMKMLSRAEEHNSWHATYNCTDELGPHDLYILKDSNYFAEFMELQITKSLKLYHKPKEGSRRARSKLDLFRRIVPPMFWRILEYVPYAVYPTSSNWTKAMQKKAAEKIITISCSNVNNNGVYHESLPDPVLDLLTGDLIRKVFLHLFIDQYASDALLEFHDLPFDKKAQWKKLATKLREPGSQLMKACRPDYNRIDVVHKIRAIARDDLGATECDDEATLGFKGEPGPPSRGGFAPEDPAKKDYGGAPGGFFG